jgi:hypothetical protein
VRSWLSEVVNVTIRQPSPSCPSNPWISRLHRQQAYDVHARDWAPRVTIGNTGKLCSSALTVAALSYPPLPSFVWIALRRI